MGAVLWLIFGGLVLLIPTAYAGMIGAPYAPTRLAVVKKAFDRLGLGAGDRLVDLGAGDGKIVLEAARRGATAVGWELSPILWLVAKVRTWRQRGAMIRYGNFYKQPLGEATVVFAFLMPNNMPRVRAYVAGQRVPHGRYFLAYAFPLADEPPLQVVREKNCAPLYVYDLQELTAASPPLT